MDDGGTGHAEDLELLRAGLRSLFGEPTDAAVRDVAASSEWIDLRGGRRLLRLGERADALYILVRGRLRASVPGPGGTVRVVGEVARGEAVGEMALLGGERRNANIDAIRDSRLVRIRTDSFRGLTERHPDFLWNLSRLVIRRLSHASAADRPRSPIRTIAVVVHGSAEVRGRTVARLREALEAHGSIAVLDDDTAATIRDAGGTAGLAAWLDDQETHHRFVLTPADGDEPGWTRTLLRQADRTLLVCPADTDPRSIDIAERTTPGTDHGLEVRTDLILLHPDGARPPARTRRWLEAHPFGGIHHVREDRGGDYERVARFLAGRAVGLVLAGGGAKGFALVGLVRALEEEGVPIDLIGGTSIGAILGAVVAFDWDDETRMRVLRGAFVATNPANDYQVPPLWSIVKGRKMERLLREHLREIAIEDLWRPFFCVSANLSGSAKHVHRHGTLWKALRASASIAGVFPPVVIDGQLHVDGGTIDNLPVDTARELGAGHVVACDIRRSVDARVSYDAVPPTRALLADLVLRRRRYRVPGLISTMMQTTFLAGLERARRMADEADLFLEPSTKGIRFLGWDRLDRAVELGHAYAVTRFADPEVRATLDELRSPS